MTTTWMDENGDIHCVVGDTFDLNLVDITDEQTNELIDFSDGYKINLKIFQSAGKKKIIEFSETDGVDTSIIGALRFKKSEAPEFKIGTAYFYDLKLTNKTGDISTVLKNKNVFVE